MKAAKNFKNSSNKSSKTKLSNPNIIGNQFPYEISPSNNKGRDYIDIYQGRSGIGKIQPVSEIKFQFNE